MTLSVKGESKLLAWHSLVYGLGNVLSHLTGLILLPLYTTYLTPFDYGTKELIGLTTDVIGILLGTAISEAFYRFYFDTDDEAERKLVISSSILTLASGGLIALVVLLPASPLFAHFILDSTDFAHYFLIAFASMWFQMLNSLGFSYLRMKRQSARVVVLSLTKLAAALGLNIYFVAFRQIGVLGILLSTLITSAAYAAILIVPMLRYSGFSYSFAKARELLVYGAPLILAQLASFTVHASDRFFLKGHQGVATAGIYALGHRIGTVPAYFVSSPFNQAWLPRRMEIFHRPDAETLFGRMFTYFLALMIFASLGISAIAYDVLRIMATEAYWSAYKIVPLVALGQIVFSMHYHVHMGLIIEKKTKYLAAINMVNAVVVLILNALLIQPFGVYGAATAALIGYANKVALTYYFSSRFYAVYFEFRRILKLIAAAAIVYAATLTIHLESPYTGIVVKTTVVLCFPLLLFFSRFFTANELLYAKQVLSVLVHRCRRLCGL